MSIRVMSLVWEWEGLDPYERLVMLSLADHSDDEGICYPSVPRLAKRTGVTERGIRKVLVRMVEKRLLEVQTNAGRGGANLYRITLTPEHGSGVNTVQGGTRFTPPLNTVPSTPEPRSPEPSRTVTEPSVSAKRGTRLSPDWTLPKPWADWAIVQGVPVAKVNLEADRFRDYWIGKAGKDAAKADWEATWRNWIRKSIADGPGAIPQPGNPQSAIDRYRKIAASHTRPQ